MYRTQTTEFKEQSKLTMLKKYGFEHYSKTLEFSELMKQLHKSQDDFFNEDKRKQTCLKRYGVEYALQSKEVQEKRIKTLLQIYGYDNISKVQEIKDKKIKTFMSIYGFDHPLKSPKIQNKIKETNLVRYGVENPMQNADIFIKNNNSDKMSYNYTFPSNDVIRIQGYEKYALDILLETNNESNIITDQNDMPEIWYDVYGNYKRYYPDIYLKNDNKIIEVKSQYTLYRDIYKNLNKKKACEYSGIKFEFWVFRNNGQLWYKL